MGACVAPLALAREVVSCDRLGDRETLLPGLPAPINAPNWPNLLNLLVCAFPDLVPVPSVLIFMSGEVEVAALARMQLGDEQGSSVRPLVAVLTPLCAMPVPGDFLAASCPLSFPWLATGRRREPN